MSRRARLCCQRLQAVVERALRDSGTVLIPAFSMGPRSVVRNLAVSARGSARFAELRHRNAPLARRNPCGAWRYGSTLDAFRRTAVALRRAWAAGKNCRRFGMIRPGAYRVSMPDE